MKNFYFYTNFKIIKKQEEQQKKTDLINLLPKTERKKNIFENEIININLDRCLPVLFCIEYFDTAHGTNAFFVSALLTIVRARLMNY